MGKETVETQNTEEKEVQEEKSVEDNKEQNIDSESQEANTEEAEKPDFDIEALKAELEEKSNKCQEYIDMLQRKAAEFDNYKKRTAKEKEGLYSQAVCDTVAAILPVVDNLERAVGAAAENNDGKSLKEGIDLVFKQMKEVMKNLGVEEIKGKGEKFDPELHNAVMHVEDDSAGESEVVEEFQKGYKVKDKVVRHSMVKVAN